MNISFSVRLPVDAHSVPLARGMLRQALEHLGVLESSIEEVVLALTEACANVVQHAGEHEEYQVDVAIDDLVCRISVVDYGDGFDVAAAAAAGVDLYVIAPRSNRPVRLVVDLLDLGASVPLVESAAEIPADLAGGGASSPR